METELEIMELLKTFFQGDLKKVGIWLNTKNPLLGNVKPIVMIRAGRSHRLLDWMKNQIEGNIA